MRQKLFIFGLGHLARRIVKLNSNFKITGTYRNFSQVEDLIDVDKIQFSLGDPIPNLSNFDRIIINFPPQSLLIEFIKKFQNHINDSQEVLFVSSTSVYGEGKSDEKAKLNGTPHSGPYLLEIEKLINNSNIICVRPGGLVDDQRNPINFFKKTGKVKSSQNHINYIHTEDVARFLLKESFKSNVYNLVAPTKYIKKDFYQKIADTYKNPLEFIQDDTPDRLISSNEPEVNNFEFLYPNLLNYFLDLSSNK